MYYLKKCFKYILTILTLAVIYLPCYLISLFLSILILKATGLNLEFLITSSLLIISAYFLFHRQIFSSSLFGLAFFHLSEGIIYLFYPQGFKYQLVVEIGLFLALYVLLYHRLEKFMRRLKNRNKPSLKGKIIKA